MAAGGVHGFPVVLTSFVGRAGAVAEVAGLLEEYRLVTVTGPGGVGKTRLAGEVAGRVAARFADGAWLAELAAVRDPAQVAAAVAVVLGVREQAGVPTADVVVRVMARRQLLLVLDNCEHMIGAAAQLCAGLLQACDDVRILATSRERLRIAGEAAYRLAPLPVPGPGDAGDDVAAAEAVTLFTDRARAADAGFALTDQDRRDAARLVGRLDGMPLAIELAAARAEALGVSQLLDVLDGRLALLAGGDRLAAGRHRSLAAAAQWSYQLLAEDERRVFRLVSVFPAPFTLEAAAAVAGDGAARAVLRLVECSLLVPPRPGPDGRSRYAMLETLRGYGAGLQAEAGEQDDAEAALARYALRVAGQAAAGMTTIAGEPPAARWLDAEDATMGHVLAWAVEHDLDTAARLVAALGMWWVLRGRLAGQGPLLRELAGRAEPGSDGWCAAQFWLGWIALDAADLPQALQRCAAVVDVTGDRAPSPILADCLHLQSVTLSNLGRVPEAAGCARRALALARDLGYPFGQAYATSALAIAACVCRRPGRCGAAGPAGRADPGYPSRGRPGVRLSAGRVPGRGGGPGRRRAGLRRHAGPGPGRRRPVRPGHAAAGDGGPGPAGRPPRRRRRAPARGSPDHPADRYVARDAERPGGLRVHMRRHRAARRRDHRMGRQRYAQPARRGRGPGPGCRRREDALREARQALGPDRARAAGQRGAAMSPATAAEYALMLTAPSLPPAQAAPAAARLSARERELVTLVARGRTDAQIAGQLYISIRTVRSHLDRIRDKTGCRRRADLTRLALTAELV